MSETQGANGCNADWGLYRHFLAVADTGSLTAAARQLGVSQPTVSRRLAAVRSRLRARLAEVFAKYSFTPDELEELQRNGIELNPKKEEDARFDDAIAEIYHRISLRAASEGAAD